MTRTKKRFFCLAALLFFIFSSCATTELTAVWENPGFHGKIGKIAIIGAFQSKANRNIFEDEFVERLSALGLDAVAGYTIIPFEKVGDTDYVMSRIMENGTDAVLETRLIDRKTEQTYVREQVHYFPDYYNDWRHYHRYIYSPGYIVNTEYAYAETNIYSLPDRKLIWSARSKTQITDSDENLIRSFVQTIVDRLSKNGLLVY
jgi:hypothetical protein